MPTVHTINDINNNYANSRNFGVLPLSQPIYTTNNDEMSQKIKTFFKTLPILTISILVICITIFISLQTTLFFEGKNWGTYLPLQYTLILQGQVWRLFTYSIYHFGVFHLFFNMISLLSLSYIFEKDVYGFFKLLTPSDTFFSNLEKKIIPQIIYKSPRYIKADNFVSLNTMCNNTQTSSSILSTNLSSQNTLWPLESTASNGSFCGQGRTLSSNK
ncbi:hypothetical protein BB561_005993 [Smittium simulii]|uniref:Peptidase S54 rhomboid domain-containing protein n=1 Tax=Smittium simulii TaxID=133385 RepID=A0A2T9Y787_9FUNG|nr:hypothetical protein BB561_005993 [Smittium simulii]